MTTGAGVAISQLATQLRVDTIRCSTAAGSGHPTLSLSAADLTAVPPANHFGYGSSAPAFRPTTSAA
jgi:transketolase